MKKNTKIQKVLKSNH